MNDNNTNEWSKSSRIITVSAPASFQGKILEWCSWGPTNTTVSWTKFIPVSTFSWL